MSEISLELNDIFKAMNTLMSAVPAKIYSRMTARSKNGWVCSPVDFLDIGSRATVDQALSRMVKAGMIRRITRGLYDMPRFNTMLNRDSPPRHDQIINAVARRDNIKIIQDNIVHANGLGLTNAVPAKSIFLTDGPTKTVKIGTWIFQMKHVPPAFMSNATSKSGPVFQALIWIGKDVVKSSPDLLLKIRTKVSSDVLTDIDRRSKKFPAWMKSVIDKALIDHAAAKEKTYA